MKLVHWVCVLLMSAALIGCGTMKELPGDKAAADAKAAEEARKAADAARTAGLAGDAAAKGAAIDEAKSQEITYESLDLDAAGIPKARVLYFDFDSSEIKNEYRDALAAHAKYLSQHPSARVTLEGHADERGTREYNIALGERRGNAVRQMLQVQGAIPSQLKVVSYGEERPIAPGHDEVSWSQNRRVELAYTSQ